MLVVVLALALGVLAPAGALAHPEQGLDDGHLEPYDPSAPLDELDGTTTSVVSDGPSAHVIKNLQVVGRGERLLPDGTTDVWAHGDYAYVGTFNAPCGTGDGYRGDTGPVALRDDLQGPGVPVFDVHNVHAPTYIGSLPSVVGSRINDVKVATMNSGDILVHSNEACAGGDGGFEVYDMSDPTNPVHLAAVRVDEANETLRTVFGGVNRGVHNLFLFTQGNRDYVAMQTHAWFGSFQIYELTDPTAPQFVSAWGAEFLCTLPFCSTDPHNETNITTLINHINLWMFDGFGTSRNRFLHDVTISDDGTRAYLSHWDAGLVLLDVSDPANPTLVSVALEPSAGDGEVNSHAAWPSADGSVVVETEEDFNFASLAIQVTGGALAGEEFGGFEDVAGPPPPRLASVGTIGPVEAVFVGQGCDTDNFSFGDVPGIFDPYLNDPSGKIAVIRRGACSFASKLARAEAAGAVAVLIANNLAGQPGLSSGTFQGVGGIPGIFISTDAGDAFEANPTGNLVVLDPDALAFNPWGNVRIWDYSDPANPVLASEFDTVCSASPDEDICDPRGTYSVHNVVVEGDKAYFSWYSDGVLILDISDPYNPVETARYTGRGEDFEEQNGGIQDIWGIWKVPDEPWLYASDRNGGLYVLKEFGAGSAKQGQSGG